MDKGVELMKSLLAAEVGEVARERLQKALDESTKLFARASTKLAEVSRCQMLFDTITRVLRDVIVLPRHLPLTCLFLLPASPLCTGHRRLQGSGGLLR